MNGFLSNINSLHKNIKTRLISDFFISIVFMGIGPFFTIYLVDGIGVKNASYILFASIVLSMCFSLLSGKILDYITYKKGILVGQVIAFISISLMAVYADKNAIYTAIFFLTMSIGMSIIMPALEALIISSVTEDDRHYMFSVFYWINNLSSSVGIVIGGIFFLKHTQFFLIIAAIVFLINIFYTYYNFENIDISRSSNKKEKSVNYLKILTNKKFIFLNFIIILLGSMELTLSNSVGVNLEKHFETNIFRLEIQGSEMLSVLLVINTVIVVIFSNIINSKIIDRTNKKLFMYSGILLYGLCFSIMQSETQFIVLLFLIILATIAEIIIFPILNSEISYLMTSNIGKYTAIMAFNSPISNSIAISLLFLSHYITNQGVGILIILMLMIIYLFLYLSGKVKLST
ncbi:MFS transporter [Mammaliicoccus sciuri]|uniref:MFS transporter n=1 Tax=Mammaliicoccus sciuri TaxID=1296 RepID=UPI0034DD863D|nr:MFS transporter [Staphylococcus aureus]